MTTGDLIRLLQAADPTGETPVCVDNEDIHYVTRMEAYYDGTLQQLVRDGQRVVGARLIRRGDKVKIRALGVQDLLLDQPEIQVDLEFGGPKRDLNQQQVELWRDEGRQLAALEAMMKAQGRAIGPPTGAGKTDGAT